jgi:hypothetical protein
MLRYVFCLALLVNVAVAIEPDKYTLSRAELEALLRTKDETAIKATERRIENLKIAISDLTTPGSRRTNRAGEIEGLSLPLTARDLPKAKKILTTLQANAAELKRPRHVATIDITKLPKIDQRNFFIPTGEPAAEFKTLELEQRVGYLVETKKTATGDVTEPVLATVERMQASDTVLAVSESGVSISIKMDASKVARGDKIKLDIPAVIDGYGNGLMIRLAH